MMLDLIAAKLERDSMQRVNALIALSIAKHMLIGNGRESRKRKCEIALWRAGVILAKWIPQ